MTPDSSEQHWLVRPGTIRWFWIAGCVLLAVTVVLQALIEIKGYFGIDGWFAFGALFGFLSCVGMVLLANGLGWLLKRNEHYYDD